jgi:hypothetical protein
MAFGDEMEGMRDIRLFLKAITPDEAFSWKMLLLVHLGVGRSGVYLKWGVIEVVEGS